MLDRQLHLLLIEDEDDHFALIRRHIDRAGDGALKLHRVDHLQAGIDYLSNGHAIDAVLSDLNLPDSRGLETFRRIRKVARSVPVIALTSQSITKDGIEVMREGAHDYLPKSKLDPDLLLRSILCAVERHTLTMAERRIDQQSGQLSMAHEIQTAILPEKVPQWQGLDIAVSSLPAEAVGGDYYDFIKLPNGEFLVVIGDATGHGPGAALIMAMAAASLRTLTAIYSDLTELLGRLNTLLFRETPSFAFMTFIAMRFSPHTGTLVYANAGHPPPLLLSGTEPCVEFCSAEGHLPLGIMEDTRFVESDPVQLHPLDMIYTITDGVVEAMNPSDVMFGQKRLDDFMRANRGKSSDEIVTSLQSMLSTWRQNRFPEDDETVLVLKRQAAHGRD